MAVRVVRMAEDPAPSGHSPGPFFEGWGKSLQIAMGPAIFRRIAVSERLQKNFSKLEGALMNCTATSWLARVACATIVASMSSSVIASSTLIVGDGGSIGGAIAGASTGDVIEIRSNQTFPETLEWQNKKLTIQAGAGYAPAVANMGSVRGPAAG